MKLTEKHAQRVARMMYGQLCSPKDARDLVLSLQRKDAFGGLDDLGEMVVAMLEVQYSMTLVELSKVAYKNWATTERERPSKENFD